MGATDSRYTGAEAATTYRYLRLGMVAMVVLLAVSILYERTQAPGCWQQSISAYHYTPVRSVFVGVLVAIGLCLIVIRGRNRWQDLFLNVAGMLAMVVALVPTSDSGSCLSTGDLPAGAGADAAPRAIAPVDIASVQNNLVALFVTAALAVVVAYAWPRNRRTGADRERVEQVSVSFAVTAVVVGAGFALFVWTDWFERVAHLAAAGGMFLCLGAAVFIRWRVSRDTAHGPTYRVIWQGMALTAAAGAVLAVLSFDHTLLVVESIEIALFVAFWIARAHQDWRPALG